MFYSQYPSKSIKLEKHNIIPSENTSQKIGDEFVYIHYINGIKKRSLDNELRHIRQKALCGILQPEDFKAINLILETTKLLAQKSYYMMPSGKFHKNIEQLYLSQVVKNQDNIDKLYKQFTAFARVNTYAMLLGQIIFVNNSIKEGMLELLSDETLSGPFIDDITSYIIESSIKNGSMVENDEARFFAMLFILQTTFDKIFVPDKLICDYNLETGNYKLPENYENITNYLKFTNKLVLTASDEEKKLCQNITSGWSDNISRPVWDLLNLYYYSQISPSTNKTNFFAKNYDDLLERMLPQFAFSKVRLAETILKNKKEGEKISITEVGAGSGAFAIDLFMACKRLSVPFDEFSYVGIEPNQTMIDNFKTNVTRKLKQNIELKNSSLKRGFLEDLTLKPEKFVTKKAQKNIIVSSYCIHHCYPGSVIDFLDSKKVQDIFDEIYVLDVTEEHGKFKMNNMWADCESPENFTTNISYSGIWKTQPFWTEPNQIIGISSVTTAWCILRKLIK